MQRIKWRYLLPAVLLSSAPGFAGTELPPAPPGNVPEPATTVPVQAAPSGNSDNSYGRLEDIQAKTMLYEAQLAQARALNELQKNGYDAVLGAPFNPQPAAQAKDGADARAAEESKALPQIVEISGGQQLSATLVLDSGNQVRVQAGSRIPGTAWTVARISFGEVTVSSAAGGLVSLAFAG